MARKRMIDPSFWEDEKLGSCEPTTRLLFMGLISQADDEGRLKGHPSLIRSIIFPYDEKITIEMVEGWLNTLSDQQHKLIIRYEVDHQKYIVIPNFKKHQTINKPQPSKLPEPLPDNYGNNTVAIHDDSVTKEEKLKEVKGIESKAKGTETDTATDSNPKDLIHSLLNKYKIQRFTGFSIDQLHSYLGIVEMAVIEASIKKGESKHFNYVLNTLQGMVKDGITKYEQLMDIPRPGEFKGRQKQQGTSGKPKLPVHRPTQPNGGLTPEEEEEFARLTEQLEGA